jgi:hypothetical protein
MPAEIAPAGGNRLCSANATSCHCSSPPNSGGFYPCLIPGLVCANEGRKGPILREHVISASHGYPVDFPTVESHAVMNNSNSAADLQLGAPGERRPANRPGSAPSVPCLASQPRLLRRPPLLGAVDRMRQRSSGSLQSSSDTRQVRDHSFVERRTADRRC